MISPPLWVSTLADAFWKVAGIVEPFPRTLRGAVSRSLPLGLVLVPNLCLAEVRARIHRFHPAALRDEKDRRLRGCLFVLNDAGLIFVDWTDPEDEQRFSFAHELAHYLRDYWQPRWLALTKFGPAIRDVLDGLRPATPSERLHSILQRVPLGYHVHWMHRDNIRPDAALMRIEEEADLLAFELLAPAQEIWNRIGNPCDLVGTSKLLQNEFGFPPMQARAYASLLFSTPTHPLLGFLRPKTDQACRNLTPEAESSGKDQQNG